MSPWRLHFRRRSDAAPSSDPWDEATQSPAQASKPRINAELSNHRPPPPTSPASTNAPIPNVRPHIVSADHQGRTTPHDTRAPPPARPLGRTDTGALRNWANGSTPSKQTGNTGTITSGGGKVSGAATSNIHEAADSAESSHSHSAKNTRASAVLTASGEPWVSRVSRPYSPTSTLAAFRNAAPICRSRQRGGDGSGTYDISALYDTYDTSIESSTQSMALLSLRGYEALTTGSGALDSGRVDDIDVTQSQPPQPPPQLPPTVTSSLWLSKSPPPSSAPAPGLPVALPTALPPSKPPASIVRQSPSPHSGKRYDSGSASRNKGRSGSGSRHHSESPARTARSAAEATEVVRQLRPLHSTSSRPETPQTSLHQRQQLTPEWQFPLPPRPSVSQSSPYFSRRSQSPPFVLQRAPLHGVLHAFPSPPSPPRTTTPCRTPVTTGAAALPPSLGYRGITSCQVFSVKVHHPTGTHEDYAARLASAVQPLILPQTPPFMSTARTSTPTPTSTALPILHLTTAATSTQNTPRTNTPSIPTAIRTPSHAIATPTSTPLPSPPRPITYSSQLPERSTVPPATPGPKPRAPFSWTPSALPYACSSHPSSAGDMTSPAPSDRANVGMVVIQGCVQLVAWVRGVDAGLLATVRYGGGGLGRELGGEVVGGEAMEAAALVRLAEAMGMHPALLAQVFLRCQEQNQQHGQQHQHERLMPQFNWLHLQQALMRQLPDVTMVGPWQLQGPIGQTYSYNNQQLLNHTNTNSTYAADQTQPTQIPDGQHFRHPHEQEQQLQNPQLQNFHQQKQQPPADWQLSGAVTAAFSGGPPAPPTQAPPPPPSRPPPPSPPALPPPPPSGPGPTIALECVWSPCVAIAPQDAPASCLPIQITSPVVQELRLLLVRHGILLADYTCMLGIGSQVLELPIPPQLIPAVLQVVFAPAMGGAAASGSGGVLLYDIATFLAAPAAVAAELQRVSQAMRMEYGGPCTAAAAAGTPAACWRDHNAPLIGDLAFLLEGADVADGAAAAAAPSGAALLAVLPPDGAVNILHVANHLFRYLTRQGNLPATVSFLADVARRALLPYISAGAGARAVSSVTTTMPVSGRHCDAITTTAGGGSGGGAVEPCVDPSLGVVSPAGTASVPYLSYPQDPVADGFQAAQTASVMSRAADRITAAPTATSAPTSVSPPQLSATWCQGDPTALNPNQGNPNAGSMISGSGGNATSGASGPVSSWAPASGCRDTLAEMVAAMAAAGDSPFTWSSLLYSSALSSAFSATDLDQPQYNADTGTADAVIQFPMYKPRRVYGSDGGGDARGLCSGPGHHLHPLPPCHRAAVHSHDCGGGSGGGGRTFDRLDEAYDTALLVSPSSAAAAHWLAAAVTAPVTPLPSDVLRVGSSVLPSGIGPMQPASGPHCTTTMAQAAAAMSIPAVASITTDAAVDAAPSSATTNLLPTMDYVCNVVLSPLTSSMMATGAECVNVAAYNDVANPAATAPYTSGGGKKPPQHTQGLSYEGMAQSACLAPPQPLSGNERTALAACALGFRDPRVEAEYESYHLRCAAQGDELVVANHCALVVLMTWRLHAVAVGRRDMPWDKLLWVSHGLLRLAGSLLAMRWPARREGLVLGMWGGEVCILALVLAGVWRWDHSTDNALARVPLEIFMHGVVRPLNNQIRVRVRLPLALLHVLLLVEFERRYAHLAHARARGGVLLLVSLLVGLVLELPRRRAFLRHRCGSQSY